MNQLMVRGPSLQTEVAGKKSKSRLTTKEIHVIFVDNGRIQAINEGFEEVLYCIRCYACHNHCPAYRLLGPGIGNDLRIPGFGYKGYIGGRGVVMSKFLFGLQKSIEAGLYTCTLCGACKKECPLNIDIPSMIGRLRNNCL